MTTPDTPDQQPSGTDGSEGQVNLNKDSAASAQTEAVYYADHVSYPAQGYPEGQAPPSGADQAAGPQEGYAQPGQDQQANQQQGYAQPGYAPSAYTEQVPPVYGAPPPGYGQPQAGYGYQAQPGYPAPAPSPYAPNPYASAYGAAYGGAGYGYAPKASSTNGLAIAALVASLAGVVLSVFCLAFIGIVTGPVAMALGLVALKQIRAEAAPDSNSRIMAIAGIVLGALQLLIPLVLLIVFVVGLTAVAR